MRSSDSRLYTPSFSTTTISLASLDDTNISTPSSVLPSSSRSVHSFVIGRPWTDGSAVPSILPLTSLPQGSVPRRVISRLPQNQPLGDADRPSDTRETPSILATSSMAPSHSRWPRK